MTSQFKRRTARHLAGALAMMTGAVPVFAHADDATLQQQVDALTKKVDALGKASSSNPLKGLTISGYIDPTYIYNKDQNISSFFFLNKNAPYTYYQSSFGDMYLDINKKFAGGSSVDIQIMPTRGYGQVSGNNSIINAAVLSVPVNDKLSLIAGQVPAWDGYESETSPQMLTITHNLLFDFSEPGFFTGAGGVYTSGPYTVQALLANTWNTTYNTAFKAPTLEYRFSVAPSSALSFGLYGTIGKNPTVTGVPTNSTRIYNDFDGTYTTGPWTFNWQLDYGRQNVGAANGDTAVWYGTSLLGNYRFTKLVGATLRYDYLNDKKNGGHIATADTLDGFITDPANPNAGTSRQALTAALLLYPWKQVIVKFEARHDWANIDAFADTSTTPITFKKSNNTLAAQVVYSF